MKHGILAHLQINSESPQPIYTFAGAAAYVLHNTGNIGYQINNLPLPNPSGKHLANAGDRIYAFGTGVVLLEGVEQ